MAPFPGLTGITQHAGGTDETDLTKHNKSLMHAQESCNLSIDDVKTILALCYTLLAATQTMKNWTAAYELKTHELKGSALVLGCC